ncbi:uncharacterized protein LOC109248688 [Panthera pardus]|uniref:Uncharacterized protein LOC109248688 n=1 Tax=Panthera pardus TaxID=9691 RepID=A0A9W2VNF8_PANPR|nr:uncharacterized protein LOC109248688 [Panthera pardus]XP_053760111.1 uncharacterized protein LOC109248688 [Panthera pardus]XP_053760112.1 uncharacterized protein LOC109248688 [Panthera pardus]
MIIRGAQSLSVRSQCAAPRKKGRISGPAPPCGDVGRCLLRPGGGGGALARPACSTDRTRDQLRDLSVLSAQEVTTDGSHYCPGCAVLQRLRYPSPSGATTAHGKSRIGWGQLRAAGRREPLPSCLPVHRRLRWPGAGSVQFRHSTCSPPSPAGLGGAGLATGHEDHQSPGHLHSGGAGCPPGILALTGSLHLQREGRPSVWKPPSRTAAPPHPWRAQPRSSLVSHHAEARQLVWGHVARVRAKLSNFGGSGEKESKGWAMPQRLFFSLYIFWSSRHPTWASNSQPRDQESHALLTQPAGRPKTVFICSI